MHRKALYMGKWAHCAFCLGCLQEEVVTITMNKYRKGQQMLEEAEHRADVAEKSMTVYKGRGRSMSVSREITRVVRV